MNQWIAGTPMISVEGRIQASLCYIIYIYMYTVYYIYKNMYIYIYMYNHILIYVFFNHIALNNLYNII